MSKIKNPHNLNQGKNITTQEQKIPITPHKHPVFCFKYLHKDYDLEDCTTEQKKCFIDQLVRLSQLEWDSINKAPRHGLGYEKINRKSIRPNLPSFITKDVEHLLAFRFDGKKPFLGHRDRFIFHVILIDRNHNSY